ncbi:Uncharacterised protein [Serratia quinivorans]|nr:Uncharacterised protein [Serratia quinivorans]CAI0972626.1 Uncharacterised protein [Serratia quinivorans]CAI1744557.1 Uncharacterised protein [Serratia quinivorans]CAI1830844.1 Uncharacterised protein [Serratia quinivorans]CAI2060069.1 Uncharacterised protein [Serratia quinivorans]
MDQRGINPTAIRELVRLILQLGSIDFPGIELHAGVFHFIEPANTPKCTPT